MGAERVGEAGLRSDAGRARGTGQFRKAP